MQNKGKVQISSNSKYGLESLQEAYKERGLTHNANTCGPGFSSPHPHERILFAEVSTMPP